MSDIYGSYVHQSATWTLDSFAILTKMRQIVTKMSLICEEMDTVIFRVTIVLIWYLHYIDDECNLLQYSSNVYRTYHEWGIP